MGNALYAASHGVPDGVAGIEAFHQVQVYHKAGVVLNHAYFLADYALLLFHALRREIGDGNKAQKGAQIIVKALGTLKIIGGHGVAGKSVGLGPVGGEHGQGVVPVRGVKHLVLEKVGHSGRGVNPLPA